MTTLENFYYGNISPHECIVKQTGTFAKVLNKLTKYRGIIEIKAPYDGVISDKITIEAGDLIYEDDRLVRISDNSSLYVPYS